MSNNNTQKVKEDLTLESLYDVPVNLSVVLGSTKMQLNNILKLNKGAVVELDKTISDPVHIYVNDKIVAEGEIVVVENRIGVTITKVIEK